MQQSSPARHRSTGALDLLDLLDLFCGNFPHMHSCRTFLEKRSKRSRRSKIACATRSWRASHTPVKASAGPGYHHSWQAQTPPTRLVCTRITVEIRRLSGARNLWPHGPIIMIQASSVAGARQVVGSLCRSNGLEGTPIEDCARLWRRTNVETAWG